MTTEEKLEHFQQYCMESARVRSARMLDEYTQALEKSFSEHQEDARRRADMEVQAEKEKIQKETNKKLSIEQINIPARLQPQAAGTEGKAVCGTAGHAGQFYRKRPSTSRCWSARLPRPWKWPAANR